MNTAAFCDAVLLMSKSAGFLLRPVAGPTVPGESSRCHRRLKIPRLSSLLFVAGLIWGTLWGQGTHPVLAQIAGGVAGGAAGQAGGAGGQAGGAAGQAGGAAGQAGGGCAGGILVDPDGVIQPMFHRERTGRLDKKRRQELAGKSLPGDLNEKSSLRKISLVQLEAACESHVRDKSHVSSEMQFLAGLQRIDYVFVYPDERDIVIAGPAEGYLIDNFGRAVGVSTGRPAMRLDDLMIALRSQERGGGAMRCSIDPNEANLKKLVAFIKQNSEATSLDVAKAQFELLGDILGMQDVSLSGVPSESHFAELFVEADIKMKRWAIGIDKPRVKGFRSHLSMVGADGNSMQRWWFTPLYDAFTKTEDGLAFQFAGQRVQLLSQEELYSDAGGRFDAPFTRISTQKFSKQFTDRFAEIAEKTPVFAELQNVFDLAVLAALIKKEQLARRVEWPMALFLDSERATIVKRNVPHKVPSVSNFKLIGNDVFVAQVTGGVSIDAWQLLKHGEYKKDSGDKLKTAREAATTEERPEAHRWWWD